MVFIWYGFYMLLMQKNVMNLNMVIYSEICYELRKTRSFWVSKWYRLVSYTKSWVGLSRQLCRGSRAHASTLPPLKPQPAKRKTFPWHRYKYKRSPVGNTFYPPPWDGKAKVLPAWLGTPYTALFHFFLYIEMEVRRKE